MTVPGPVDPTSRPTPIGVKAGDVLAGKYVVERVLGAGGMGVVVAAHHTALETKVAIKFLLAEALTDEEAVQRFAREARAAVQITSEHVARVFDVGTLDDGAPYIVMEYLEGGDLAGWLRQRGVLPVEQAVEFVLQACVAIAEAHALGIVHRDLKPANLFCIRRPDGLLAVKVLDFGISKVTAQGRGSAAGMSLTSSSAMMGTPLYMSPEQIQSAKAADAQSDVWSLGVTLYELLGGRVPFDGATVGELAVKTATLRPPSLRALRPEVPPELEAVVLRCLERDRERRYRNVGELARALAKFAPARARGAIDRITNTVHAASAPRDSLDAPPSPQVVVPGPNGGALSVTALDVGQSATSFSGSAHSAPSPSVGSRGLSVSGRWAAVIAASAVGVAVATAVLVPRPRHGDESAAANHAALGPLASVAAPSPAEGPRSSTLGSRDGSPGSEPVAAPLAETVASAVATATANPHRAPITPASRPPTTATKAATNRKPADCDPPYTLDDEGHKQFKPACF